MKEIEVSIPAGDITLEGRWHLPDGDGDFPAVIVCHPHPLQGGELRNNVVRAVYWEMERRGIAALRFNFRGVGRSGGTYGDGIREQDDLTAVIDFTLAQEKVDVNRLGVVGYSFGGGVSVPVAGRDSRMKALVLVSPMLSVENWVSLHTCPVPKLLIVGTEDAFFPLAGYEASFGAVAEPKRLHVVPGADHFWQGYEAELAAQAGQFLAECFGE